MRAPPYLSQIRKSCNRWATSGYQFEPHRHRARGLSSNRARAQPASHARPRSYMACPHAIVQVLFTVGSFDIGTGGWLTCHRSSLPLNPPSKPRTGPTRALARVRAEPCDEEEAPVDVPRRGGHVFRSREAAELRGLICGKIGTKKTGRLFWAADERA